eukprot:TRINITY_DN8483_c0_g1_i1.p1 TRINITY_DN8483_c0_g1~~TRINITY_DN8483_c0_g1_i1.p1  ORF type:complete len:492 (-),score=68.58 TRINITY_DN8483_c0_g1_i1:40-1461(-)
MCTLGTPEPPKTVYALLHKAKPYWSAKDLCKVHQKLQRVSINDCESLARAVSDGDLNKILSRAGERRLKTSTLAQLRMVLREPYRLLQSGHRETHPLQEKKCYCGTCLKAVMCEQLEHQSPTKSPPSRHEDDTKLSALDVKLQSPAPSRPKHDLIKSKSATHLPALPGHKRSPGRRMSSASGGAPTAAVTAPVLAPPVRMAPPAPVVPIHVRSQHQLQTQTLANFGSDAFSLGSGIFAAAMNAIQLPDESGSSWVSGTTDHFGDDPTCKSPSKAPHFADASWFNGLANTSIKTAPTPLEPRSLVRYASSNNTMGNTSATSRSYTSFGDDPVSVSPSEDPSSISSGLRPTALTRAASNDRVREMSAVKAGSFGSFFVGGDSQADGWEPDMEEGDEMKMHDADMPEFEDRYTLGSVEQPAFRIPAPLGKRATSPEISVPVAPRPAPQPKPPAADVNRRAGELRIRQRHNIIRAYG